MEANEANDNGVRAVRELWSTYRDAGAEAATALLDPEVEFVDHEGRRFSGRDGVRRFFAGFREQGEEFSAAPLTIERHQAEVLVVGERRIRGADQVLFDLLYFVHSVSDGRVRRIAAHSSKRAALADIAARAGDRGS